MILTVGPGGCGFTFLNWSIAYLRGDNEYIDFYGNLAPVDINPLIDSKAHRFQKDHLRAIDPRTELLKNCHDKSIIYMIPKDSNDFEYILSLPGKKIIFDNRVNTRDLLARACLTVPDTNLYMDFVEVLSARYPRPNVIEVLLDLSDKFVCSYPVPAGYFALTYNQIFKTLDEQIEPMMQYLDLTIDVNRIGPWHDIYSTYRDRNSDFVARLQGTVTPVDKTTKLQILKEILEWRRGLFLNS